MTNRHQTFMRKAKQMCRAAAAPGYFLTTATTLSYATTISHAAYERKFYSYILPQWQVESVKDKARDEEQEEMTKTRKVFGRLNQDEAPNNSRFRINDFPACAGQDV